MMTDYRELLRSRRLQNTPAAVQAALDDESMVIMPSASAAAQLVSQADIARRHGVTRAAANQWAGMAGFPRPLISAGRTRLWDAPEVDQWVGQRRGHAPE